MKRPPALFFGTPEFAIPSLEALHRLAEIAAVVTPADAPRGRGQQPQASAIREHAERLHLPVQTPMRLDEAFIRQIKALKPEVAVLAGYGKILPPKLLAIPAKGFLNIHPSLLPKHRGPSPVAGALLAGDTVTGVTVIVLDDKLDHGPIIAQRTLPIKPHEHRPQLEQRLANLGAEVLTSSLLPYLRDELPVEPQDHTHATFTKMMERQDAIIDWRHSSVDIENQIRALDPWPGTITHWRGSTLKILDGRKLDHQTPEQKPGTVIIIIKETPAVVCGQGVLVLTRLQLPGKSPTDGPAFLRGYKDFAGAVLG